MVLRYSNSREQLLRHLIIFIALQSAAAGTFLCPGLNCTEQDLNIPLYDYSNNILHALRPDLIDFLLLGLGASKF